MRFAVPSWQTFEAGAEAAEEIAAALGAPLAKADPKILSSSGYDRAVRDLVRKLSKATAGPERDAMRAFAAKLDREWATMTEEARAKVIASAAKGIIGIPELVIGKVQKAILTQVGEVVRIAKRDTGRVHRLQITPTFTAQDKRIIKFAADSQGSYITTRYRERAYAYEQKARDIVSNGIKDGLGRKDIGAILREQIVSPALRTSEAYWETVASVHTARARSWGQLSGFSEAEITMFEVEAVLDEETTDQCRFLHGRRFSVSKAIDSFEAVQQSDDPEAVKKLQPWLKVGKTADGDGMIYVDRGGRKSKLADITQSAVGTADKIGSYKSSLSDAAVQALGVGTPPYHGRCRTTIVPA